MNTIKLEIVSRKTGRKCIVSVSKYVYRKEEGEFILSPLFSVFYDDELKELKNILMDNKISFSIDKRKLEGNNFAHRVIILSIKHYASIVLSMSNSFQIKK